MQGAHDRKSAATGTVGKALALLDVVADAEEPPRFTEIVQVTGQPRGTVHRQLTHLVDEGLLSVNRNNTYSLGLRLLRLAAHSWSKNEFRAIAEPHLNRLHRLTTETVHLGVLNGTEIIYLDKVESQRAVRMYSQIGNTSPVYCTGVGKAALSTLDDNALSDLVSRIEFHRFTKNTLVDPKALLAEIDEIRRCGTAFDREEHEIGIHCIAAPICVSEGTAAAAISVTGPAYRVSVEQLEGWSDAVRETALAITTDIGIRLSPRA